MHRITNEIGSEQIETLRTPGHATLLCIRPSGGICKGVGSWRLKFVPNGSNQSIAPSRVLYRARTAAVDLPAPRSNE
jgi:hypothetical protein